MSKSPIARIYRGTPGNVARLAQRLRHGELVAVPTETVYGLAANAFDPAACTAIFHAKGRPSTDPLIVHLASADQLSEVAKPNGDALRVARKFWPGPLTLVLPKTALVPGVVTAGRSSVAVRVPSHPLFRRLLRVARVPLAAPSANPFGYISPTTAEHVREGLGTKIRYILDGGPCPIGVESTILDLRNPRWPRLLRPGAITREQLEATLGRRVRVMRRKASSDGAQLAPGMLARHYSPHTPVVLHEKLTPAADRRAAYLFFRRPAGAKRRNVFWLDEHGDLRAAARRLFATLRQLDAAGFSALHVELAPGDGLAHAINDRLRRAAAR